jgi:phosphatidylglycerophosphatase GEP4
MLIGAKYKFRELREAYPGSRLLIVSNTAGTAGDPRGLQARLLEENTEVTVLRHSTKARPQRVVGLGLMGW